MSKGLKISIAVFAVLVVLMLSMGGCAVSYYNTAIDLEARFKATQENNKNEMDLMKKKIAQTAQIPKAHVDKLEKIVIAHAKARGGGGHLFKMVTESIPEVPETTWLNLQNIITSSRDKFAANQKMLLDIKREHDALRGKFPSSLIVGGRPELAAVIVTSTDTEKAFETGKDDDTDLGLMQ
jgi:hypothetical protein